jgi:hypothetical protein
MGLGVYFAFLRSFLSAWCMGWEGFSTAGRVEVSKTPMSLSDLEIALTEVQIQKHCVLC